MIIRSMRVAKLWMFHEPGDTSPQRWSRVLCDHILERLPEPVVMSATIKQIEGKTYSRAHASGGASIAKLSRYLSIGAHLFLYRLCTAPPDPIIR